MNTNERENLLDETMPDNHDEIRFRCKSCGTDFVITNWSESERDGRSPVYCPLCRDKTRWNQGKK